LRASTPTTVTQAGAALVAGMRSGAIPDRSGKPYKPKTVRTYEHALKTYIYPLLGKRKISTLRRADVQGFVEEMCALGAAPSTVHNRLDPLRVIVRRAIDNDEPLVDPCAGLRCRSSATTAPGSRPQPRARSARRRYSGFSRKSEGFWAIVHWRHARSA
jgi:Phage integrase, N-terminal SAM-like domain